MKALIHLLRGILALVWVLLLGLNIRLYVGETVEGHTPPQLGGWAFWTVEDMAMEPAYAEGDLLLVEMGRAGEPGQAVLVRTEEGLALRRIIGTSEGQFILKSDGAEDSGFVDPQAVVGISGAYLPGCGQAAAFLRSLPGIVVVFLAGLVLLVLPGVMPRPAKQRPQPRGGYAPRH
ncbi:S24 family peptidase [Acutalibacter caecimuris]|uniref:S24 family peptidase n=1 Tax=Acutalibacter caecimuris TaxID=3093657 RepID=UPI002AC8CEA7|nr:S24 family peptidase [Acutalibacter sp. M00118]